MLLLLDPRFWLVAVLWTAVTAGLGYFKGGKDERAEQDRERLKAVQAARETEQDIRHMQDRSTLRYLDRMHQQQEKANALPKIVLVNDCAVPADVGRVLNDAQHMPADAGAGSSAGAAGAEADSTCAAELDIAKRNYAEVCVPNAEQLTELQKRWAEVRQRLLHQQGSKP